MKPADRKKLKDGGKEEQLPLPTLRSGGQLRRQDHCNSNGHICQRRHRLAIHTGTWLI